MALLALFVLMGAGAALYLVAPLVAKRAAAAGAEDRDYLIAQIAEIERDRDAGLIDAAESEAALTEARRRLLQSPETGAPTAPTSDMASKAAVALVALAPIAAFALYVSLGNPARKATDAGLALAQAATPAPAEMTPDEREAMIAGMVEGLAARLADNPDDAEGWAMLARSYGVLGRYDDAAAAYDRAIALDPGNLELLIFRAEAFIAKAQSAGEPMNREAEAAVEAVAARAPDHPFALFFLGLAASERGDVRAARDKWAALLDIMPPDAAETASLRKMIDALPPAE